MASSVVHKKLSFLDPTVNEDADLSQSTSRSTSIIGKSGSANQSSDRKSDVENHILMSQLYDPSGKMDQNGLGEHSKP